jgi:hypothetical protein
MNGGGSTLYKLIEEMRQHSPEHLDLFASLSDDDFQMAFDSLLGKALSGLEESKNNFKSLDEPGLSAVLRLAMLVPGLSVTLEQYSNGHADLTFDSYCLGIARRIIGEAKIYNGPQYHINGIKQLLGYMTGREIRGLMVVYMRKANGSTLMKHVRETIDAGQPENQVGPTTSNPLKWAFDSHHHHSSGDSARISHVTCNLHVAG